MGIRRRGWREASRESENLAACLIDFSMARVHRGRDEYL